MHMAKFALLRTSSLSTAITPSIADLVICRVWTMQQLANHDATRLEIHTRRVTYTVGQVILLVNYGQHLLLVWVLWLWHVMSSMFVITLAGLGLESSLMQYVSPTPVRTFHF